MHAVHFMSLYFVSHIALPSLLNRRTAIGRESRGGAFDTRIVWRDRCGRE